MKQTTIFPFICHKEPFVCHIQRQDARFIGRLVPSVGFTGFTLVELMITLAVLGILGILVVPAMTTFIHSNRLTTATNQFIGALNLARTEAIKRGVNVGVCKSDNGSSCTGTGTWESGWIVYLDADNNGPWTASDSLIQVEDAVPPGITFTVVTGSDSITYDRQGIVPAASPNELAYLLCSSKIDKAREVSINSIGRVSFAASSCP